MAKMTGSITIKRAAKPGADAIDINVTPSAILHKKSGEKQTYTVSVTVSRGNTTLVYGEGWLCSTLNPPTGLTWAFRAQGVFFTYALSVGADAEVNADLPFTITISDSDVPYNKTIVFRTVADGSDGEDGYTVTVKPSTLETDEKGVPKKTSGPSGFEYLAVAEIEARRGGVAVPVTSVAIGSAQHCTGRVQDGKAYLMNIESFKQTVEGVPTPVSMYWADGHIDLSVTVGDTTLPVRWQWHLDYTYFFGSFLADDRKLESRLVAVTEEQGTLKEQMSEIRQTADEISLQVSGMSSLRRNLLTGSYLRASYNTYGGKIFKAYLKEGKDYTFSVNGRCSPQLAALGYKLKAFVFHEDSGGAWDWQVFAAITATEDATASVTFSTRTSDGWALGDALVEVCVFPFKADDSASGYTGTAGLVVNWLQLEEGAAATPWTLSEDEPETNRNLLPSLTQMAAPGVDITTDGFAVPGGKITADYIHYKNTGTGIFDAVRLNGTDIIPLGEAHKTYTLSFWAKGSDFIDSFLYPEATLGTVGDDGAAKVGDAAQGALYDGWTRTTLAPRGEWRRYAVTFTVGALAQRPNLIVARLQQGGELWLAAPKLEEGGRATAYGVEDALLATGIQIRDREITVVADNFSIENNSGEKTFETDKDGYVTIRHMALGGMLSKTIVEVRGDADAAKYFGKYTITNADDSAFSPGTEVYRTPPVNGMYGIYRIKQPTSTPFSIELPSFFGTWEGMTEAESEGLMAIRCLVGNTVLIYNETDADVEVLGMSPSYVDVVDKQPTATRASSMAKAAGDTVTNPFEPDEGGVIVPSDAQQGYTYRFVGIRRPETRVVLKAGRFASMRCVCEVSATEGMVGQECVYWILQRGYGSLPGYPVPGS